MLTEDCRDRLINWKFVSAVHRLDDGATDDERELVAALARLFGNVGHGLEGDVGMLAGFAVAGLCAASGDGPSAFLLGRQTAVPPTGGPPPAHVP